MPSGVTFGFLTSLYQACRAGTSAPNAPSADAQGSLARQAALNTRRSVLSLCPRSAEPNSCRAQVSAVSASGSSRGFSRTHAGSSLSSGERSPRRFLKSETTGYM